MTPRSSRRHQIVKEESRAQLDFSDPRPAVNRPGEAQGFHQVRGNAKEGFSLSYRFVNEVELRILEIPDSTVHEARGPARGAAREVLALEKRYAEAPHGGIPRDPTAGDPAPDDEHVEDFAGKGRHCLRFTGEGLFREWEFESKNRIAAFSDGCDNESGHCTQ